MKLFVIFLIVCGAVLLVTLAATLLAVFSAKDVVDKAVDAGQQTIKEAEK